MITENLSTLKIHKLSQNQYDRVLSSGNIDQNALYLTPDEGVDLSNYETKENAQLKYDTIIEAKADWNQNDENAIDYIKNRTHWAEIGKVMIDTLTFDGNIEGKEICTYPLTGYKYIRVSDDYVPVSDLIGGTYNVTYINYHGSGEVYQVDTFDINEESVTIDDMSEMFGFPFYTLYGYDYDIIVLSQDIYDNGVLMFKKGIYLFCDPEETDVYVSELKVPNAVFSIEGEVIHHIDPKYIKDMYYTEGSSGMVEILPECKPVYSEADDGFVSEAAVTIEGDQTVTVNWNGTEYECKTYWMSMDAENDTVVCGNSEFLTQFGYTVESNELPFVIVAILNASVYMFLPIDGSTDITVSIYQGGREIIHHLDPKYIKDMYYTEQKPAESLSETTYESVSSPIQLETALSITAGANYTVMWNGAPYECVAAETSSGDHTYKYMGNGYLGRMYLGANAEDTGEPFFILTALSANEGVTLIIFNDGSTTVTLSYEGVVNIIHKIDAKYLPEMPNTSVTYTLTKSGSTITLTGSDGSETSVTDSDTVKTYTLSSFGVTASSSEINKLDGLTATTAELNILSGLTTTTTELNRLDGLTATASELNKLDGVTATTEELNYITGVKSPIQTQINNKPGKQGTGYRAEIFNDYTGNTSSSEYSHAEGSGTTASAAQSHAEGYKTIASGNSSHAEGRITTASGLYSHAEGQAYQTTIEFTGAAGATTYQVVSDDLGRDDLIGARVMVSNNYDNNPKIVAVDENNNTVTLDKTISSENAINSTSYDVKNGEASGDSSHAEGHSTTASGNSSHAEGIRTTASGNSSHAEGFCTIASGGDSHAEGSTTTASGINSHAEGFCTIAAGEDSHAEGIGTIASGRFSHAEGFCTIATGDDQHVQGRYNLEASDRYAHIVGNGDSDTERSNAHTLDWDGNAWYAGTVTATAIILRSSTEGSTKTFKLTINDSGELSITENT